MLLLVAFREGAVRSIWAVSLPCLLQCGSIADATTEVVRKTRGRPAETICIVAFAFSIA